MLWTPSATCKAPWLTFSHACFSRFRHVKSDYLLLACPVGHVKSQFFLLTCFQIRYWACGMTIILICMPPTGYSGMRNQFFRASHALRAMIEHVKLVFLYLACPARNDGQQKDTVHCTVSFLRGEDGIWTHARLLTAYSLSRGAPSAAWVLLLNKTTLSQGCLKIILKTFPLVKQYQGCFSTNSST